MLYNRETANFHFVLPSSDDADAEDENENFPRLVYRTTAAIGSATILDL